jgi:Family of unknown function (DUF6090)
MAELEVAKHTKKVYKIWNSKQHSFWHKCKEFFLEILIIVFAVTLSIWFHNLSEKRHDRAEAKVFLTGLKTDLQNDIAEMKEDTMSYHQQNHFFKLLADSSAAIKDTTVFGENYWMFSNTTALIPNISRFEALKYSGKMNMIENKELLDEILNLYQEKTPKLVETGNSTGNFKNNLISNYFDEKMLFGKHKQTQLLQYIKTDERLRYIFKRSSSNMPYIIRLYKEVILQNKKLITMIDKELE